MDLKKNEYYLTVFKNPWTYVKGAVLLSIFQIVSFAATVNPWGVSGAFAYWGAWIFELFGGNVDKWYYFSNSATLDAGFINSASSLRNVGVIFGALLATLLASQFRIKKLKSWRQVIAAMLGGLLMGYGARIASGCNIGALFSGISSLSLSGWVYALFILLGAFVGGKLLTKFFM